MASNRERRVIVIGGGFAGLGAVKTLLSSSLNLNVTLLEATSSLGGRIHTIPIDGEPQALELGATILHGEVGNSLYELANQLQIRTIKSRDRSPNEKLRLLSNGVEIPADSFDTYVKMITDIFEEICVCSETRDWSHSEHRDDPKWTKSDNKIPQTYSEYVLERLQSITRSEGKEERELALQMADYCLSREDVMNGSDKAAPCSYHEFEFPAGEESIPIVGGYQTLVDKLKADIPQNIVHLNKEVYSINWSPANTTSDDSDSAAVCINCSDGSVYKVDHVIVTVSLGVLKDTHQQLFSPPLPLSKQEAIAKLGFGLMVKLAMKFEEPPVDDIYRKVDFVWRDEERNQLSQYPWALHIYCINRVGASNWWTTWFTNNEAVLLQDLSEDILIEGMTKVLETFLKRRVQPPTSVSTINWGTERFFRGSYSYNTNESSKKEREELATPLGGETTPFQLLFAGEATHNKLYSTANGAYDTGVREAERLIQYYYTKPQEVKNSTNETIVDQSKVI